MIGPDIDKSGVPSNVVNAIRIHAAHLGLLNRALVNLAGSLFGAPFLAVVLVVSENFLLLFTPPKTVKSDST